MALSPSQAAFLRALLIPLRRSLRLLISAAAVETMLPTGRPYRKVNCRRHDERPRHQRDPAQAHPVALPGLPCGLPGGGLEGRRCAAAARDVAAALRGTRRGGSV